MGTKITWLWCQHSSLRKFFGQALIRNIAPEKQLPQISKKSPKKTTKPVSRGVLNSLVKQPEARPAASQIHHPVLVLHRYFPIVWPERGRRSQKRDANTDGITHTSTSYKKAYFLVCNPVHAWRDPQNYNYTVTRPDARQWQS